VIQKGHAMHPFINRALAACVAVLVLLAIAAPVFAQTLRHCAPRAAVLERLQSKYGETRQAYGLVANGSMMEVFADADSGSWTVTVTMTNGVTCLLASGADYEALTEALPPQGDPL
jgi:hypothetical protein